MYHEYFHGIFVQAAVFHYYSSGALLNLLSTLGARVKASLILLHLYLIKPGEFNSL